MEEIARLIGRVLRRPDDHGRGAPPCAKRSASCVPSSRRTRSSVGALRINGYRDYVIVGLVAAVATWACTFVVRRLAVRFSIIVVPDDRRVHERPTPTVGGAAMYLGLLVAMVVASQLHGLSPLFRGSSDPIGLVLAASVIFTVGMVGRPAGDVAAGQAVRPDPGRHGAVPLRHQHAVLPGARSPAPPWSCRPTWCPVLTVLWVVGMANAVNLVDGLDGLAAGIVGIASLAFFLYSHQLVHTGHHRPGELGAALLGDRHRPVRRVPAPQLPPGPDLHGRCRRHAARVC